MDQISSLPDEILGHILTFLSTKQAASTSLLSKRWRNVFVLVTSLELRYRDRFYYGETRQYLSAIRKNFMGFVESLLCLQGKSPIKKLTLEINRSGLDPTRVENWICNVLERGVEDLNLVITCKGKFKVLPLSIFKSKTLVKLRLGGRGFKMNRSQDLYLPKLRKLYLNSVDFDGVRDFFKTLLPHCPVLEELVVEDQLWGDSVYSPSLKKLCFRCSYIPIIFLDVPNLVYLEFSCFFGSKYVNVNLDSLVEAKLGIWVEDKRLQDLRRGSTHSIPANMIDLFSGVRNVRVLHLTCDALELFYFSGQELPRFDSLVRLSISTNKKQGWQILPLLIRNSPNLETLIFKGLQHYLTTNCGDICCCYGSKENSSSCLSSSSVKVLEIWHLEGTSGELNQMMHFLKKLPCLELVVIRVANNLKEPINIQHLLTLPRASSNCKIIQAIF